jgi:DNA-binding transcriptional LysR family regulator
VDVVFIGRLSRSIYACASHEIFSRSSGGDVPIAEHPFAQLSPDVDNDDVLRFLGMPPVRFRTDALSTLIRVCCEGEYLSVLPDVAVAGVDDLRPLTGPEIAALPLYAVRRVRLVEEDLVDKTLNAIVARLPEG